MNQLLTIIKTEWEKALFGLALVALLLSAVGAAASLWGAKPAPPAAPQGGPPVQSLFSDNAFAFLSEPPAEALALPEPHAFSFRLRLRPKPEPKPGKGKATVPTRPDPGNGTTTASTTRPDSAPDKDPATPATPGKTGKAVPEVARPTPPRPVPTVILGYSGYMNLSSGMVALLKDVRRDQCQFVAPGHAIGKITVTSFNDDALTLQGSDGQTHIIPLGEQRQLSLE